MVHLFPLYSKIGARDALKRDTPQTIVTAIVDSSSGRSVSNQSESSVNEMWVESTCTDGLELAAHVGRALVAGPLRGTPDFYL